MLINWFTVFAEMLNFLILVWLLKRFLYKPILNAIDAREKMISDQLANTEKHRIEAEAEKEAFALKNETFDKEREAMMRQVEETAKVRHAELLEIARKDAEALQERWNKSFMSHENLLSQSVSHQAEQEIFDIARKVLFDLSGASLEARMIEVFLKKVMTMSVESREHLSRAMNASYKPAIIRTMFELTSEQKRLLEERLSESLGIRLPFVFEKSTDLISGIELIVNDQKISWNISAYLESLKESIRDVLVS